MKTFVIFSALLVLTAALPVDEPKSSDGLEVVADLHPRDKRDSADLPADEPKSEEEQKDQARDKRSLLGYSSGLGYATGYPYTSLAYTTPLAVHPAPIIETPYYASPYYLGGLGYSSWGGHNGLGWRSYDLGWGNHYGTYGGWW